MPLSWTDIRSNAVAFSREWKNESSEDAEAKSFWDAFFKVFGINRRRIATFEKPVVKSDGKGGYIDLLWKGILLVEHKSLGKDLDRAFDQAKNYFPGLKERDLPRYIVVSDFARFRLYDLDGDEPPVEFKLEDFHKNVKSFGFIAGYQTRSFRQQDPVNIEAAEKLGRLHDLLKAAKYEGHQLEVFLVRVLFCLFAEDNAIFEVAQFREWIEQRTADDGSDLGPLLAQLFETLNTPEDIRQENLDEHIAAFRYINGRLFEEPIRMAALNRRMREMILECTALDWSRISPAIFGALFQSIMDKKARRNLGAHYTSETNILKALQPLFLDELRAEFLRVRRSSKQLGEFHERLRNIRILDPACGCGNFLVIAYRELRLLELDVLRSLFPEPREGLLDVSNIVFVDVDQFFGIESEEFPSQIAQVALWMTDHQMNQKVSEEFGKYFARLPLRRSPTIVYGNALDRDWASIIDPTTLSFLIGNPPFKGKSLQNAKQKAEMKEVFRGVQGAGVLDYVAAWYKKAAEMMVINTLVKTAFVSTNSITQGEQVGILWGNLLARGVQINFAHRTFEWSSEAKGKAAVHCVIIGMTLNKPDIRMLFEYETVKSEPHAIFANNINPYLVDAANILLTSRRETVSPCPTIRYGSMANDEGHLLLSNSEKEELLLLEPEARKWIRPFAQVDEFLYGSTRWCLWLVGISPAELNSLPLVRARVEKVRAYRKDSERETTKELADQPTLFGEIRQPHDQYLLMPGHTSEARTYIPIGYMSSSVICGNANFLFPAATSYDFGIITSLMHMSWVRVVCGRIKSDYRYSAGIVYNNFPWPEPTPKQRETITTAAQVILEERAKYPDSTLADLYGPLSMPPGLVKAHHALDRAVDAAYGKTSFVSEAERVAFLFTLYEKLTSLFPTAKPSRKRSRTLRA